SKPAVRVAQVDVFTARPRAQRGQLRVPHRTGERQESADDERREERNRRWRRCGDLRRIEQNAAADDVGDDDRGRVEGTETALEDLRRRCGRHPRDYMGYSVSSWRSIGYSPIFTHVREPCFPKICTFASTNWLFC